MHEFGLCESIIDAVQRRAAGRPVTEVRLRIGALHRVEQASMTQAFTFAAAGTVAEGATVEVITVPVLTSCAGCDERSESTEPLPACPSCGGTALTLVGGDELLLESIRVASVAPGSHEPAHDTISEADDGHTHDGRPPHPHPHASSPAGV